MYFRIVTRHSRVIVSASNILCAVDKAARTEFKAAPARWRQDLEAKILFEWLSVQILFARHHCSSFDPTSTLSLFQSSALPSVLLSAWPLACSAFNFIFCSAVSFACCSTCNFVSRSAFSELCLCACWESVQWVVFTSMCSSNVLMIGQVQVGCHLTVSSSLIRPIQALSTRSYHMLSSLHCSCTSLPRNNRTNNGVSIEGNHGSYHNRPHAITHPPILSSPTADRTPKHSSTHSLVTACQRTEEKEATFDHTFYPFFTKHLSIMISMWYICIQADIVKKIRFSEDMVYLRKLIRCWTIKNTSE